MVKTEAVWSKKQKQGSVSDYDVKIKAYGKLSDALKSQTGRAQTQEIHRVQIRVSPRSSQPSF